MRMVTVTVGVCGDRGIEGNSHGGGYLLNNRRGYLWILRERLRRVFDHASSPRFRLLAGFDVA